MYRLAFLFVWAAVVLGSNPQLSSLVLISEGAMRLSRKAKGETYFLKEYDLPVKADSACDGFFVLDKSSVPSLPQGSYEVFLNSEPQGDEGTRLTLIMDNVYIYDLNATQCGGVVQGVACVDDPPLRRREARSHVLRSAEATMTSVVEHFTAWSWRPARQLPSSKKSHQLVFSTSAQQDSVVFHSL